MPNRGMLLPMGIAQRDWVLDTVERLGQALARILGLAKEGKHEEALAAIETAEKELLGADLKSLERADVSTAAVLLRGAGRVRGWGQLQAERAEILSAMGQKVAARAAARRARVLYAAAERRGVELSEFDRAARERLSLLDKD